MRKERIKLTWQGDTQTTTITAQNAVRESVTEKIIGDADATLISARRVRMICVWGVTNANRLKMNPMEKINGIRVGRKFYKVIKSDVPNRDCSVCDLQDKCGWLQGATDICIQAIGIGNIFRFSPELTDKLNK